MTARTRREGGQATVELALVLPVVVLVILLVVQVGVVVAGRVAVVGAARDGARRAALDGDDRAATAVVAGDVGSDGTTVVVRRVAGGPDGGVVEVRVRHTIRTVLPIVGPLVPDVTVEATARMPEERR